MARHGCADIDACGPCTIANVERVDVERADLGMGGRMAGELTIYIVDDSPLVRERLIESFADIPNVRVVGEAASLDEALVGVSAAKPRVLIVDVQLRKGSGLLLLKQMRAAHAFRPERVIIVTNYPTEAYRQAGEECGADHFFDKASEFDRVREVLIQLNSAA